MFSLERCFFNFKYSIHRFYGIALCWIAPNSIDLSKNLQLLSVIRNTVVQKSSKPLLNQASFDTNETEVDLNDLW